MQITKAAIVSAIEMLPANKHAITLRGMRHLSSMSVGNNEIIPSGQVLKIALRGDSKAGRISAWLYRAIWPAFDPGADYDFAEVVAVACPKCGLAAGILCHTPKSVVARKMHQARAMVACRDESWRQTVADEKHNRGASARRDRDVRRNEDGYYAR